MPTIHGQYIVCDKPRPSIRVVRFICPEYRNEIYDCEPITDSSLFKDIATTALAGLAERETVVVNCGLIEWFPSRYFSLFLTLKKFVTEKKARLVLCCLTPVVKEAFDLLRGWDQFEVEDSENQAVKLAAK